MLSGGPARWFRAFPVTRMDVPGLHCVLLDMDIPTPRAAKR